MASKSASPLKVGILSIGDMGEGVAKLLIAHGFAVATNCKGRSQDTVERAKAAGVELLPTDSELVSQCRVILSIVPPADAAPIAQRVVDAVSMTPGAASPAAPMYLVDLNAVSPAAARATARMVAQSRQPMRFVDGCILGSPPRRRESSPVIDPDSASVSSAVAITPTTERTWSRPGMPTSGPYSLADLQLPAAASGSEEEEGKRLFEALNMRHLGPEVGAASGLKMCFASTTKGFTAIAVQAFTTARRLGVLADLEEEMRTRIPDHYRLARGMTSMPPKAYRWVREMEEISATHDEDGGFEPWLFRGAAGVYRAVAEDTVLGKEKIGKRKRGTTVEDLALAMAEGLEAKRKKNE